MAITLAKFVKQQTAFNAAVEKSVSDLAEDVQVLKEPPPEVLTSPIPPLPSAEEENLRNSNSWMAMTLLDVMNILGMTDGTMKDLPDHARKVMEELKSLRR